MASAYDEIKKVLAMLRQGGPMTEQNRSELNRFKTMLEQRLATDELTETDLPPAMVEPHDAARNSISVREVSEP
jgi:hypothetical protein